MKAFKRARINIYIDQLIAGFQICNHLYCQTSLKHIGDCSISDTDNAIFKGLKFKLGAKIGSKMFSKKFSNFLEDSPKYSPIFLEILQKYWRISNIIGESPKIKLENALIVVYYLNF